MNSLSWFLYFASVVDRLSIVITILLAASALLAAVSIAVWMFSFECYSFTDKELKEKERSAAIKVLCRVLPLGVFLAVLVALIPAKQTLYLIAASEIGEKLSQTEAVSQLSKEAYDILHGYLRSVSDELKPKGGK